MTATAFMEDEDLNGQRDDLIACGTIEKAPEWLACKGSRWVLRINSRGVRHESEADQIESRAMEQIERKPSDVGPK